MLARVYGLVLLLVFQKGIASSDSTSLCSLVLKSVVDDQLDVVEPGLLAGFEPATLSLQTVTRLGKGVYKVPLKGDAFGVVRVSREVDDIKFEAFGSRLLRSVPGLATPRPRELPVTEQMVRLFLEKERAGPGPDEDLIKQWNQGERPPASLSVFFPMETGAAYLDRLAGFGFRKGAENAAVELRRSPATERASVKARIAEALELQWASLAPDAKRAVLKDLKALALVEKSFGEGSPVASLVKGMDSDNSVVFTQLRESAWNHIPAKIQAQLADYWAIFTVLGISDFHADNWLIHQDKVLAIDLAMLTAIFQRGILKASWMAQLSPVGPPPSEAMRQAMISQVTPSTREFLKRLTRESIKRMAEEAGYAVTDRMVDGMLARAKAFY